MGSLFHTTTPGEWREWREAIGSFVNKIIFFLFFELTDSKKVNVINTKRQRGVTKISNCNHFLLLLIIAAPAEFNRDFLGEPKITPFPPDSRAAVALKCEVPVNDFIRSWKNVTYQITWYSGGKRLNTAHRICGSLPAPLTNSTIIPDYELPCLKKGVPLFSRLEGKEYNLHRWVCYLKLNP